MLSRPGGCPVPEPMKKGETRSALQRGAKGHAALALPSVFTAAGQSEHPPSWLSILSPATACQAIQSGEKGKQVSHACRWLLCKG